MTALEPLYTAAEMQAAEAAFAGPTLELMERAGRATAEAVLRRYPHARRFSVWCGTGANGGDGLVVARHLLAAGREPEIMLAGPEEKLAGDTAENLRRAREVNVHFATEPGSADVVVDALFGTGFSGAPRRDAAATIESLRAQEGAVVSVDVPSGVDASTGRVAGIAVEADVTVTFHGRKLGLAIGPGRFLAGEVEIADIGLSHTETRNARVTPEILRLVPRRSVRDNKYTSGHVVVVGGSRGLTGAPYLTSEAAMRAGAGYVRACVPEPIEAAFAQRVVEVTTTAAPAGADGRMTAEAAEVVLAAAERAHVVALGPGLGRSDGVRELVRALLERLEVPVVLDGDALWAISDHLEWVFSREAPTVLTPHAGELARLLGRDAAWVDANRLDAAGGAADDVGAVVLLKGADTLVAAPGRGVLVCDLGNPGLASAGTGDVLTGVVAAFLAQGMDASRAAAAAAAAAGVAADEAATLHGWTGLLARDVVGALSRVLSAHT